MKTIFSMRAAPHAPAPAPAPPPAPAPAPATLDTSPVPGPPERWVENDILFNNTVIIIRRIPIIIINVWLFEQHSSRPGRQKQV